MAAVVIVAIAGMTLLNAESIVRVYSSETDIIEMTV